MKKSDYTNPEEHIFYCDKSDWYDIVEVNYEGIVQERKVWSKSQDKIEEFWSEIRKEKMAKLDYDFSDFIFPEFLKDNFWEEEQKKFESLEKYSFISFKDAEFIGVAYFREAQFTGVVDFRGAQLNDWANFGDAQFTGEVDFGLAQFNEWAQFSEAQFNKGANFRGTQFNEKADFLKAQFHEMAHFFNAQFHGEAEFFQAQFAGSADYSNADFTRGANFWEAQFTGVAGFASVPFKGEATFSGAHFIEEPYFGGAQFYEMASFGRAQFNKGANFWGAQFHEMANFLNAQFHGDAIFVNGHFVGEANFLQAQFNGEANFSNAQFKRDTNFHYCTFEGKLSFVEFQFDSSAFLKFRSTKFSKDHLSLFKDWQLSEVTKKKQLVIIFQEVIFNDHVEFLDCDFTHVTFEKCDLTDAKFSNCQFPRKRFRTRFLNENYFKGDGNEKKEKTSKRKHYDMIGEVYRQLKTNMIGSKYWQEAGDAYRSEMVMRRKVLKYQWRENPLRISIAFNWLINLIHDGLSAFQQSMARPFLLLVFSWFGFALVYYNYSIEPDWTISWTVLKKSAIDSAFYLLAPLGRISSENWDPFTPHDQLIRSIIYLERLLGGILITFFILATRARMKQ